TSCENVADMLHKSWFVLPPLMAYYYKAHDPFYKNLPPFREDCKAERKNIMEFIYPEENNTLFLPTDFDGTTNDLILKVAHAQPELVVFWYLDQKYLGSTKDIHEFAMKPTPGKHIITAVDALGNESRRSIIISE